MQANPTLLRMKYARIVELFAIKTGMTLEDALEKFYDSKTYMLISNGISDMHCMSDGYLADELILEYSKSNAEAKSQGNKQLTINN